MLTWWPEYNLSTLKHIHPVQVTYAIVSISYQIRRALIHFKMRMQQAIPKSETECVYLYISAEYH